MDLNRFIPFDGNSVYSAAGLLRAWPAGGPKELWRVNTGASIGATVEAGGRAFLTSQLDGKQWALCLDAKTGKQLWRTELAPEFLLPNHWWETVASPLVDGDRVYYIPYGRLGDVRNGTPENKNEVPSVICLQASDGKIVWRTGGEIPFVNGFATPLIVGEILFIQPKVEKEVLLALDKKTGKVLWSGKEQKPKRNGAPFSGASPSYMEIDGVGQLVMGLGNFEIVGVSTKDGSVLWTVEREMGHGLMCSAAVAGTRVLVCSGEYRFSRCLDIQPADGKFTAKILYKSIKNQVNWFHTPSIYNGAVYGFGSFRMQCTDLASGETLWEQENHRDWDTKQQMNVADGLIFALTKEKELVLAEAEKSAYKELGRVVHGLDLGHTQQPTLANGRLYIRAREVFLRKVTMERSPGCAGNTGAIRQSCSRRACAFREQDVCLLRPRLRR